MTDHDSRNSDLVVKKSMLKSLVEDDLKPLRTKQRKLLDLSRVTGRDAGTNYGRLNTRDVHEERFINFNDIPKVASKYSSVTTLVKFKEVPRSVPRIS